MRGFLFGALLLGCSAGGGNGAPSDQNQGGTGSTGGTEQLGGAGSGGESTGGTGGSAGSSDLCQDGDERLCSCAPGYGGVQRCGVFGWNICDCPDWPPEGGAGGGSAGTGGSSSAEPWLGRGCTTGTDDCQADAPDLPTGKVPLCVQADGLSGGSSRPGYCSFACAEPSDDTTECEALSGECMPVGSLISHCVAW